MSEASRPGVLLVDDDELLLNAIKRELRPTRRPVFAATSAEQAGALLAEHEIGVIVCEPRKLQLAAFLIEARAHRPATVRLILTGYPDMTSVIKAFNEAHPFKLLTKPWLDEELVATVKLAFEQYAVNVKRDRLIDEYAGIRGNAERAHAFHVLDALMLSAHPDMNEAAIRDLPVGALLLKDGAVALVNSAAPRFLAALGLPAPGAGTGVADLPAALADMVVAARGVPQRQRAGHRLPDGGRLDYFVLDIAAGTLLAFAPVPQAGR